MLAKTQQIMPFLELTKLKNGQKAARRLQQNLQDAQVATTHLDLLLWASRNKVTLILTDYKLRNTVLVRATGSAKDKSRTFTVELFTFVCNCDKPTDFVSLYVACLIQVRAKSKTFYLEA